MNESVNMAKTSAQAIWSLILGILSFLCFGLFTGVPAVICGHLARSNIKKSQGALTGGGMALAGLILGYIGTVVTTLGVIAAIAIPNFMAYRTKAFCSQVESAANHTVAAMTEFYSNPNNTGLPTLDELAAVTGYSPMESVTVELSGTENYPVITVFDNSGKCPLGKYLVINQDNYPGEWGQ